MKKGLVSIMIPCYNGEKFIERLFDSLLMQSYQNLQIIFVNDGSNDKTEKTALFYKKRFEENRVEFIYLYQKNRGQASAINKAISFLNGEFCMWFDSDDFMANNHIEKKVEFLNDNPEIQLVMCKGYIVDENRNILGTLGEEVAVGTLFEDIIFEYRRCTPGLFMVRTRELLSNLKNQKIYETKVGQNMQLLLPISKNGRNGYLNEFLFYYVFRKNSHSRSFYCSEDYIKRFEDLEDVKVKVVKELELEKEYKKRLIYFIRLLSLIQKINQLGCNISYENTTYLKKLKDEFLDLSEIPTVLKGKRLFLWGASKTSEQICKILNYSSGYPIKGYIDSDKNKVGIKINNIEVYSVDVLDCEEIYLIIPLEVHDNILRELQKRKLIAKVDFFYPKYELKKFLESRKNADF